MHKLTHKSLRARFEMRNEMPAMRMEQEEAAEIENFAEKHFEKIPEVFAELTHSGWTLCAPSKTLENRWTARKAHKKFHSFTRTIKSKVRSARENQQVSVSFTCSIRLPVRCLGADSAGKGPRSSIVVIYGYRGAIERANWATCAVHASIEAIQVLTLPALAVKTLFWSIFVSKLFFFFLSSSSVVFRVSSWKRKDSYQQGAPGQSRGAGTEKKLQ